MMDLMEVLWIEMGEFSYDSGLLDTLHVLTVFLSTAPE